MANERRLIYADALMKSIRSFRWIGPPNTLKLMFEYLRLIIRDEPTVDAVEVVRCKYCASGKGSKHKACPLYRDGLMKDDDFCSYGERITDEN